MNGSDLRSFHRCHISISTHHQPIYTHIHTHTLSLSHQSYLQIHPPTFTSYIVKNGLHRPLPSRPRRHRLHAPQPPTLHLERKHRIPPAPIHPIPQCQQQQRHLYSRCRNRYWVCLHLPHHNTSSHNAKLTTVKKNLAPRPPPPIPQRHTSRLRHLLRAIPRAGISPIKHLPPASQHPGGDSGGVRGEV